MQLDTGNRYLKKRDENNILTVGMEKTPYINTMIFTWYDKGVVFVIPKCKMYNFQ